MSALALSVDSERLVIAYLTAQPDVAAIAAGRVSNALPPAPVYPRVGVARIGGRTPPPQRIDHPRLRILCYGTAQGDANLLYRTTRAAMAAIVGVHPLGTVTQAIEVSNEGWFPDPIAPGIPQTPRYSFSFQLTVHPN